MRILAASDIHGNLKALRELKEKSKFADLVLIAGDFTIFEQNIKQILTKINQLGKVLIIPGNHESLKSIKYVNDYFPNIINIQEKIHHHKVPIFGMEGNGFGTIDPYFEKISSQVLPIVKGQPFILMTHAPPYKTELDKLERSSHCGNKSIRKFIERAKPKLAICGHIHENHGKIDQIKNTQIINPGPTGMLIDF